MAGKKKQDAEGRGKTSRSSSVFDREAGSRLLDHECVACGRPIAMLVRREARHELVR